jgi:RNA polymerase sigma factor (sigma-70 family)
LAYSAVGSLGQSEDLSQETFITAWLHLGKLAEPEKLRSWLCGIARNLINNAIRQQGREPAHAAETLETEHESPSLEPLPPDQAIGREEEAILWRSIERIPELYREPLVLFYRENRSVEQVAAALELSEDAVKQRLSRGRKLLHEEVLAFVEGALERTNPGKAFTIGVLAALPAMAISAKAATMGAAAAKGSASAKAATATGVLGAILSPAMVIFGNYLGYRASVESAHSDEERGHIKALCRKVGWIELAGLIVLAAPTFWLCRNQEGHSLLFSLLFVELVVIYVLAIFLFVLKAIRVRRKQLAGLLAREYAGNFPQPAFEYRSRLSFLGLPLLHVRLGDRFDLLRGPVKAWIAFGGIHAVGGLFASGALAVAPISIGLCAIGLIPIGGITLGLFSHGALSFGALSCGGVALGFWSLGGCAFAWRVAQGGVAHAAQANNEIATQFIQSNMFFRYALSVSHHSILFNLVWVIPLFIQWQILARKRSGNQN